jgi:hypothetical protein
VLDPSVAVLEMLVDRGIRRVGGTGRVVPVHQLRADLLDEESVGGRDGHLVQVLPEQPVQRRDDAVPGHKHPGRLSLAHLVGFLVDEHVAGGVVDVGNGHVRDHVDAHERGPRALQLGVH